MEGVCDEERYGAMSLRIEVTFDEALEGNKEMRHDIFRYRFCFECIQQPFHDSCIDRISPSRVNKSVSSCTHACAVIDGC